MFVIIILILSILLQLVAAFMVWRLIKVTGNQWSWVFIAVAMVLQASRRALTLIGLINGQLTASEVETSELIGLVISALMVVGVVSIKPFFMAQARSIVERKRAEDGMRESEIKYRIVADNTYDWEIWISPEGKFLYSSPSCRRITGHDAEEFLADPDLLYRIIHPDDRSLWESHLHDAMQKNKSVEVEFRVIHPDGTYRWIHHICQPVHHSNGRFLGVRGSNRDITRHKQDDDALKVSENILKTVFDNARDGILLADIETKKFKMGNRRISEMLGFNEEELKNIGVLDIHPENDLPYAIERFEKMVMNEIIISKDVPVKRKDGSIFYAEINSSSVIIEGRTYLLGIFRDITERKQAAEELQESELKYRRLTDSITDIFISLDIKMRITYWNKASEILGFTTEGVAGKSVYDVIPDIKDTPVESLIKEVLRTHIKGMLIYQYSIQGKEKYWEIDAYPYENGISVFVKDITERIRVENELKKTYEELKRTQVQLIQSGKLVARGEMASGIVHELTQPLLGIKGFELALLQDLRDLKVKSPILEHDIRKFMEQSEADLEIIQKQTDRMTKIINSVRSFAHKSSDKEWMDINSQIENVLILFSEQLRTHNISIATNFASGLPRIFANLNEFQQVIINLITNARDALEAKGKEGQLTITTGRSNNGIYIEVEDTGTGADAQTVSHMFEPFFSTKKEGMGLGLSIISRIISDQGGTINVECKPGVGCKFTILLPLRGNDKNG